MALTSEFINAVNSRNLLRVRIMLKDSLLVDKRFILFKEMRTYAESRDLNIWMEKTEEIEIANRSEWDVDLMNLELTRLVNDFTKEHLVYCQSIIKKVYRIPPYSSQENYSQGYSNPGSTTRQYTIGSNTKPGGSNEDYTTILKSTSEINKILRDNKSEQGDRTWKYSDIEIIQTAAKRINAACENIKSRRR